MARISEVILALGNRVPAALQGPNPTRPDPGDGSARVLLSPEPEGAATTLSLVDETRRSLSDPARGLAWDEEAPPEFDQPDPETDGSVRQRGVEALAYYVSFRYGAPWGIFIREEGLSYVVATVFPPSSPPESFLALQRAFRFLYLHEYFHFLTDIAAAAAEMVAEVPLYFPFLSRHQPWSDLSEALANAFVLRRFPRPGFRPQMKSFMRSQPGGYGDFDDWIRRFHEGQRSLAAEVIGTQPPLQGLPLTNLLFDLERQAVDETDVPVHLVPKKNSRLGPLRLIQRIAELIETQKFLRDLSAVPEKIRTRWESKTKRFLSENALYPGLNFEKLKGYANIFSVRVDREYRATLRPAAGPRWEALRIGRHDAVYAVPV